MGLLSDSVFSSPHAKLSGTAIPRTAFASIIEPREVSVSQRELVEPHKGDKRYQRRDSNGQFSDSDDQSRSLAQDVKRPSSHKMPRNEGDKSD